MVLIGIITGEYEGNSYAKLIAVEEFEGRAGCYGRNAVISKAQYKLVKDEILPNKDLYLGSEVQLYYDRFGKVCNIALLNN